MKIAAYLLYCLIWDFGILAGCTYLVFWKGYSGWWFLLAGIIASSGGFKTETFRDLAGLPKKVTA